jgi:hypothetical protein
MELLTTENGGVLVVPGAEAGSLVTQPGQLQYGDVLLGGLTSARWRELVGWRDAAGTATDTNRPQAHGAYPGRVFSGSQVVTFTWLLRGTSADKLAALAALEANLPLDGVERSLVVDDGAGPTERMARVLQRTLPPMDKAFRPGPLVCSVQFLCADPRRYDLTATLTDMTLAAASGGLVYPLVYPLDYGTPGGGHPVSLLNAGSTDAPLVATFYGPVSDVTLVSSTGWRMSFDLTLTAGEFLTVDTADGTALLNGDADRLYTITSDSSPLEACTLPPGITTLTFVTSTGVGSASVVHRTAYL